MSWITETENKSWGQKLVCRILMQGPIPHHVAFIMDGNRRYATKNSLDRAVGHLHGFERLAHTLEWCLDLGINEVTVYAFSIENFKRSREEVDGLMELARQKFARLMQDKELIHKHGVRFRVLGNISLLPIDIQQIIAEGVEMTKNNNRAFLNVCFSYTSRDEMCSAIKDVADGVKLGLIRDSDISEELLDKCMYGSGDPDLLVRTSGEVRLSDFLLWQSTHSVLSFMPVLWPEFSIWHLYAGVLHYQQHHKEVQEAKDDHAFDLEHLQHESDYQCVLKEIEIDKQDEIVQNSDSLQTRIKRYAQDRESRIQKFLLHLQTKKDTFIENLLKSKASASVCT